MPKITIDASRIRHIFREVQGHLGEDTPEHRQILVDAANRPENFAGRDRFGNDWFVEVRDDGTQIWVQVRDDQITNGGVNLTPRNFDLAEYSAVPGASEAS
jgi:hypothetical protein